MEGGKSRVLFRRVRRRETMECEDLVKEVRRGRLLCRRGGEGRVLLGVVFRRSSFDTYTVHTVSINIHSCIYRNRETNVIKLIPIQIPLPINNPFPNALIPEIRPFGTKIKPLLLGQIQREQFLADPEQRIRVVEQSAAVLAVLQVQVEEADFLGRAHEAFDFRGVVGEEFGEGETEEGGCWDVLGEGGDFFDAVHGVYGVICGVVHAVSVFAILRLMDVAGCWI